MEIFYAKSPEISLATSPAVQAVHGVLFTFNLRTFGYRLLLSDITLQRSDVTVTHTEAITNRIGIVGQ